MYNQKSQCALLQIKYTTDKQSTDLEINIKKHHFFKFIYDVLKQRRNSKTQYKHEKQRKLQQNGVFFLILISRSVLCLSVVYLICNKTH